MQPTSRACYIDSPTPTRLLPSATTGSNSRTHLHKIVQEEQQQQQHQRQSPVRSPLHYAAPNTDDDYGYVGRFRPIASDAIGARAILVQDISDGVLGRPVSFESKLTDLNLRFKHFSNLNIVKCFAVDGSRAGSGNLEILVNGGRVTSSVRALGSQRFVASFTPHETGRHTVQITFNDETVPGN